MSKQISYVLHTPTHDTLVLLSHFSEIPFDLLSVILLREYKTDNESKPKLDLFLFIVRQRTVPAGCRVLGTAIFLLTP